jgi:GDP-mannose 6-dehydrogenase
MRRDLAGTLGVRVSVFGLGKVGSVTAACLARAGHDVFGVDVAPDRVAALQAGAAPGREPGLADLFADLLQQGRLRVTTDGQEAVAQSSVALICVHTPQEASGELDTSAVHAVGDLIGRALAGTQRPYTVVLRSTVLPGTTEQVLLPALEPARRDLGRSLGLAVNPEFLRAGSALADAAAPPFTLVGCDDDATATVLRTLYAWVDAPFVQTSIRAAEMVKCASNAFHALKVAFANEIGDLCAVLGVDADEVMRAFLLDRKLNLGPAYLRPGFAFGGPCLGKDLGGLLEAGRRAGSSLPLLSAILPSNDQQIERSCRGILATGGRRVAVVGLGFKPTTSVVHGSAVLDLVRQLFASGCELRILDPAVAPSDWDSLDVDGVRWCRDVTELLADAEVVVLGGGPDAVEARHRARADQIVIDLARGDAREWWAGRRADSGVPGGRPGA